MGVIWLRLSSCSFQLCGSSAALFRSVNVLDHAREQVRSRAVVFSLVSSYSVVLKSSFHVIVERRS